MGYWHRQWLWLFQSGIFCVCLQMIHAIPGFNATSLDLGQKITRLASKEFDIYVGGVNFVAQLTLNLDLLLNLTIGPVKEKEHCVPNSAPCDNHVKVLEIDAAHNMLLVCGSAYNGTCTLHRLDNIYDWHCLYDDGNKDGADIVSGRHEQTSVVHFLTPTAIKINVSETEEDMFPQHNCRTEGFGPEAANSNEFDTNKYGSSQPSKSGTDYDSSFSTYRSAKLTKVHAGETFNTGNKNTDNNNFFQRDDVTAQGSANILNDALRFQSNLMVARSVYNQRSSIDPLLSLRRIIFVGPHYSIGYARGQNSTPVALQVNITNQKSIIPEYKLSFTWEQYSYFLFLQQTTECDKPGPCVVTKISRTCHDSNAITPYVEISLSCENTKAGKKYRLLTSAALGTVGLQMNSSYVTVPVLLMAFGNGSSPLATTADPKYGTTICVTTLDYLDKQEFDFVVDMCADAEEHDLVKHVSWISGSRQKCLKEPHQSEKCSANTKNQYIQGTGLSELQAPHFIKDVSVVTILTHTHRVTNANQGPAIPIEKMDVFLLTNQGHFRKFSVQAKKTNEVFSTNVDKVLTNSFDLRENITSQPQGVMDHSRAVLYIASGRKIMEFDLESCLHYQTCTECRDHNGVCRWCPKENKCRDKNIAQVECQRAMEKACPPQLHRFSPASVPKKGGTLLTLTGTNLGIQSQGAVNVSVCGQSCDNVLANDNNVTCRVREQCHSCSDNCNITISVSGQQNSDGSTSTSDLPQQPKLQYVTINVTSFSPKFGPVSGGTVLQFQGQNVKAGSSTRVTIGGYPCNVEPDTHLICRIADDNKRKPHRGEIVVSIDNFVTTLETEKFEFRPNPKITSFRPLATIARGGVTVTAMGSYLDSVESPKLKLIMPYTVPGGNTTLFSDFQSRCYTAANNTNMTCKTPDVSRLFTDTVSVMITLDMDGTDLLNQLTGPRKMTVYGDPMIVEINIAEAGISRGTKTFILRGERIPYWIDYSDIIVTIGNVTVDIIDVKHTQIICDVTKAIDMYELNSEDGGNISHTEVPYTKENTNYTTAMTTSNKTRITATTIKPKVKITTTSPKRIRSSTKPFNQPPQLLVNYSFLKNRSGSDYDTRANLSVFERNRSKEDNYENRTAFSTSASHGGHVSTTRSYSRSHGSQYNVTIKIGNYEKELGYVIIGPYENKGDMSTENQTGSAKSAKSANLDIAFNAGASGAGLIFLLLVITSCVMYVRARKARAQVKEHAFYMGSLSGSQHGSKEGALPSLKQILHSVIEPDKRDDMDKLIISLGRLTVGKSIGSGNFGCVFEGFLSMDKDAPAHKVAVKTLQDPSSHNIDLHAFVQEAVLMREFQHPHVLGLIGLAEKEPGIPYVILPYMDNGDLLTFVRDSSVCLSLHDVIKFGADIASGMAYLSTLKFVHRDLAARNCMLDDVYRVKVADFGLCRDIYEKGYYTSDNRKKLPIRWMAVESIEHGAYSSKSDVWSFGVVLWELLSRGVTPYPGVNGWDVINFLRHRRLAPPYFCPDQMYDLMMQCWAKDPNLRPDFIILQTELLRMIGQNPTVTDTIKRRRGDALPIYNNLPVEDSTAATKITNKTTDKKSKPAQKNLRGNVQTKEIFLKNVNKEAMESTDDNEGKGKIYANLRLPENTVITNVLIVIPTCYSHRDVSKAAAGVYIQIVDNYEPPPKFSNALLRSIKKDRKKSHDHHSKGSKIDNHSKADSSGYSFPGEYPPTTSSTGDVLKNETGSRSRNSEGSIGGSKDKGYYELETTSLRSSAVSESHSGWSMMNRTGSCGSILEVQSQDSPLSISCASTASSLSVPQSHRPNSSTRATAFNKSSPLVNPKSSDQKTEEGDNGARKKDLFTHL